MLLRAVYRGVLYHEPLTPGKTTVDVQVFEPTDKAGSFAVTAHAVILQPGGSDLMVGEEYNIENKTQPPVAYYRSDGSFLFSLPDGAQISDVIIGFPSFSARPECPSSKLRSIRARTRRPSVYPHSAPATAACASPTMCPYPDNQVTLRLHLFAVSKAGRLAIFAPPTVQVSGGCASVSPAGQEQGFSVYMMRESDLLPTPPCRSASVWHSSSAYLQAAPASGRTGSC